jgi:hypothetical protein
MWDDLSFDVRSFSPESWGPSWGLTWEGAQALFLDNGGGPDSSDSPRGYTETEADVEHAELKASHGRRMYAPQVADAQISPPAAPAAVEPEPLATPVVEPAPFYSDVAVSDAAIAVTNAAIAVASLSAELELKKQQQQDEEEEFLALLLASLD